MSQHGTDSSIFDKMAVFHYRHLIRNFLNNAQIMGNEQACETILLLKFMQ